MENTEVRLARIEEGMVRVHDRISSNHAEVMGALKPVQKLHDDVTVLKRDRFWLFTISSFAFTMSAWALIEHFGK